MEAARRTLNVLYAGRVLPFDSKAANVYATIFAERRAAGQPISQADCQIAAIARSQEAIVATRNVVDLRGRGLRSSILGKPPLSICMATEGQYGEFLVLMSRNCQRLL